LFFLFKKFFFQAFLREQTCRFLDDKFVTFNNIMKSYICLATAEIYRKVSFYSFTI